MYILLSDKSITDGRSYGLRSYQIIGGWIHKVDESPEIPMAIPIGTEFIDLRGLTILPGFIDIHVHGGGGYDTMDGSLESLCGLAAFKVEEGVTNFVPTLITAKNDRVKDAIAAINAAIKQGTNGADISGIFFEGPYINPKYMGGHTKESIRPIDLTEMTELIDLAQSAVHGGVVSINIAPELENGLEAIASMSAVNINCRMGHSAATYEETKRGSDAGANIIVHTYNAMSPIHHREPGITVAALTLDKLYAELICDFHHVSLPAIKLLLQAKNPDKIILVTDAIAPAGLPDGEYHLGTIIKEDGVCRNQDGKIAGSCITMIDCVKNMYKKVGIPLIDVISMVTSVPAKALGMYPNIGSLQEKTRANIIAIDEDFNIRFVMVNGKIYKQTMRGFEYV